MCDDERCDARSRAFEIQSPSPLKAIKTAIEVKGLVPLDERLPWSGGRLCSFSAKDARENRDSAVPELLCDVSKQQVARLRQTATQMQQLGRVRILLLFQVP